MSGPNHIVGGFVFTGLFGSFLGFNVFGDFVSIVVCVVAACLPDIDHPASWIGRPLYPISKAINKRYGHRTITHSLSALIFSTCVFCGICISIGAASVYVSIFALAFSSHLLYDMMTVQGVPLLYPFLKNRFVLPGRPDLRLNTRNVRSELIVFLLFCFTLFFMKDLFAHGFWTSYNRQFGTIKHLSSEFIRSDKALLINYDVSQLSEACQGQGILLDCSSDGFTVLDDARGVKRFNASDYHFRQFQWEFSDKDIVRERCTFYSIDLDSIHSVLSQPIINLKLKSDATLVWQDEQDIREARFYSSKFNDGLVIDGCDGCHFSGSYDLVQLKAETVLVSD